VDIITAEELALYLDVDLTASLSMKVDLANAIVSDLPYRTPLVDPVPSRIQAITLEVAARAVRNPNGYSSETIDDYTYRRDADTRQAGIYVTDSERAELLALRSVRPRGSFYSVGLASPLDLQ